MLIEHEGRRPSIHPTAYVAPTAVLCGQVVIGPYARVMFGAVLVAEGGEVTLGESAVVLENAVLRATPRYPCEVDAHVLIGTGAALTGCRIECGSVVGPQAVVLHDAVVGARAEISAHALVHLGARLRADSAVPVGWVAVGDPAQLCPPGERETIERLLAPRDLPGTAYGVPRGEDGLLRLTELTRRFGRSLGRHRHDEPVHDDQVYGKQVHPEQV